jgi:hypothetical protein
MLLTIQIHHDGQWHDAAGLDTLDRRLALHLAEWGST